METTEQIGDQPQPTATTTTSSSETTAELERHSSFLGYRPGIEVTAEEPETSADTEITEGERNRNGSGRGNSGRGRPKLAPRRPAKGVP